MKFKVGDRVQILNETYGGTVIQCLPPASYEIDADHGFPETHEESNLVSSPDPQDYDNQMPILEEQGKDQEKGNVYSGKPIKPKVIDLHSWEIIDKTSHLEKRKILLKQLEYFRNEMNRAMSTNTKEIIFIHGVGEGVLRRGIRNQIDEFYPDAQYTDASFKDYGPGGATKVRLF